MKQYWFHRHPVSLSIFVKLLGGGREKGWWWWEVVVVGGRGWREGKGELIACELHPSRWENRYRCVHNNKFI